MATEITYEPASPAAGDALTFSVTGEAPEGSRITVTADGDELQASPPFGLEDAPEGTGSDRFTLQITGGSGGTFVLEVYEYGDDPSETDPIYYHNDGVYTYPDSDDIIDALEAALPGLDVDVVRDGAALTVILGGQYAGRDMQMTIDAAGIAGSETSALVDAVQSSGPYVWGPIVLPADVYTVDVVDEDDVSLLAATVEITIS